MRYRLSDDACAIIERRLAAAGFRPEVAERAPREVTVRPTLRRPPDAPAWHAPVLHLAARRGVVGIALGRDVYLRPSSLSGRDELLLALLAHETTHVAQALATGTAQFLTRYVLSYLAGRARGASDRAAYRALSAERQARSVERPLDGEPPIRTLLVPLGECAET